jgi:hypothetical protein
VVALGIGVSVAYYNTKSLGFDENTKLFDYDDEKVTFMDFDIYYEDVSNVIYNVSKYIPKEVTTI